VSHYEFSPVVILLMALLIIVALRRAIGLPRGQFAEALPKSAPASNRTSRVAEALILLCAASAILVLAATNSSTGGLLLMLDRLRPGFAVTNIAVAIVAAAGVILGVLVALFGRTSLGVLVAAVVLSCYGMVLNGPGDWLESLAPAGSTEKAGAYTLRLSKGNVVGAELYVNGVLLGKTPVVTTFDEFLEKVPYWSEPPKGYRDRTGEVHELHYSPRGTGGYSIYQKWAQFELPRQYGSKRYYYARVKLDGQWGHFEGGDGGGGGGGGKYTYSAERHFPAVFPHRRQRMEKLLDKARLNDYRVGGEWFEAMETFGQDGPITVRKAMDKEPDMINVLDDWARWRYELRKVTDAESAWQTFERICAEADELQSYSTASVAGRAVELLVGRLDAGRLVRRAVNIISSTYNYGWSSWPLNGRFQFGMTYRPEGLSTGFRRITGHWRGGGGGRLPVSGYAVAHAIWMLDESLDPRHDSQVNLVERKVVPALICRHSDRMETLRLAAHLGGPDIERFLQRRDWRVDPRRLPFSRQVHVHGQDVNGSLFLLANLRSPMGREFRRQESRRLMNLADSFHLDSIEDYSLFGHNPFAFLFIDKYLAKKYWPRFKARTLAHGKGYYALKQQFHYLVNMEPATTVEMYVDAWRGSSQEYSSVQQALSVLNNLSDRKKEEVVSAIEQIIREDVGNIEGFGGDQARLRDFLVGHIKRNNWTDARKARDIIENLKARTDEYKPQGVAEWLENNEPGHPLVQMLAYATEPELRLLVMGALQEHPTPTNRKLLAMLLQDRNEQVREAARGVDAALTKLRRTAAAQFAAGPDERAGRLSTR
jgi:hypothetical protein